MFITLILTKKWFDLILSGEKLEEYREIKPYWLRRLVDNWEDYDDSHVFEGEYRKAYGFIKFKNGYGADVPSFFIEWKGLEVKTPEPGWAPDEFLGKKYFALKLGKVLLQRNIQ